MVKITSILILVQAAAVLGLGINKRPFERSGSVNTAQLDRRAVPSEHQALQDRQASRSSIINRDEFRQKQRQAREASRTAGRALAPRQSPGTRTYPLCGARRADSYQYAVFYEHDSPGNNYDTSAYSSPSEQSCANDCSFLGTACGGSAWDITTQTCTRKTRAAIGAPMTFGLAAQSSVSHEGVSCADLESIYSSTTMDYCCDQPARSFPRCAGDQQGLSGYAHYPGYDISQNDLTTPEQPIRGLTSRTACEAQCNQYTACAGLQFNSNGNLCWLKAGTIRRPGLLRTLADNGPFIAYKGLTCQQTATLATTVQQNDCCDN